MTEALDVAAVTEPPSDLNRQTSPASTKKAVRFEQADDDGDADSSHGPVSGQSGSASAPPAAQGSGGPLLEGLLSNWSHNLGPLQAVRLAVLLTVVGYAAIMVLLVMGHMDDEEGGLEPHESPAEPHESPAAKRFYIQDDQFMRDGIPTVIRSGSLHYFRVPPLYWRDRMLRMKALGLNTITAYVAWNFHEEVEGHIHNLEMVSTFLQQAHDEGMMVILRPGPYICGEWEFGGLPSFLLAKPGIKLRTYNKPFLDAVDRWLHTLYASISSKAHSNGGPIIAVQIENEYGSFGNCQSNSDDAKYMEHLYDLAHSYFGPHILYTTTDGGKDKADNILQRGSPWRNSSKVFACIGGLLSSDYSKKFAEQKIFNARGNSPKMWLELWVGWFTVWDDAHQANKSATQTSAVGEASFRDGVKTMVNEGASFSLYMAHGGTNFGFWSGANGDPTKNGPESFKPDITSHDYSSPISEAGDHNIGLDGGDLFFAVQEAISSMYGEAPKEPAPIAKEAYGNVFFKEGTPLFANLDDLQTCSRQVDDDSPFPTFEDLGQQAGFMLYRRTPDSRGADSFSYHNLHFNSHIVHDRVQVFVDGFFVGSAYRRDGDTSVTVPKGKSMYLLLENMGRINYGQGMYDYKGLLMKPPVKGIWKAYCIPLASKAVQGLPFFEGIQPIIGQPFFRRGTLRISGTPKDTFLDTGGLTKGMVWLNGHNLGRFWATQGPQYTLYAPAPYLRSGDNEVIVLDLEGSPAKNIASVASPRYPPSMKEEQGSLFV